MIHPVEPHEIEAAGNGPIDESRWLSGEHVKREIYKPKFKLTYLVGALLGVAAFIGIVIGALT